MNKKELKKLINKTIKFSSNRTYGKIVTSIILDIIKKESYINGDWHDNKSIKIFNNLL